MIACHARNRTLFAIIVLPKPHVPRGGDQACAAACGSSLWAGMLTPLLQRRWEAWTTMPTWRTRYEPFSSGPTVAATGPPQHLRISLDSDGNLYGSTAAQAAFQAVACCISP
jgi:hypothetical protein